MNSLDQLETKEKYIKRINKLTPDSKTIWGKMNASQMLHHLNDFFEIATEHKKIKEYTALKLLSLIFGGMFKRRIILSKDPMSKNIGNTPLPVASDFNIEKDPNSVFTVTKLSIFSCPCF